MQAVTTTTALDVDASFTVPASLDAVRAPRAALARALHDTGWDEDAAGYVILALVEALANAVQHGSEPEGRVGVDLTVDPAGVRVVVRDDGRPGAQPPRAVVTPPDTTSERGRGLVLMRAVADAMEVRPAGAGTEVVLEFRRAA